MGEFASQTALAGLRPRVMLRCLGLSALIAFAVAGCKPHAGMAWDEEEIDPLTYGVVAANVRNGDAGYRTLARRFMSDGKMTYGELGQLNDYHRREYADRGRRELAQAVRP